MRPDEHALVRPPGSLDPPRTRLVIEDLPQLALTGLQFRGDEDVVSTQKGAGVAEGVVFDALVLFEGAERRLDDPLDVAIIVHVAEE